MIDPRTTNIIGQRVVIIRRAEQQTLGRGVMRVVDYQEGAFAFLIEAIGAIDGLAIDGSLFQVTTWDETIEIIVDRVSSLQDLAVTEPTCPHCGKVGA